MTSNEAENYDEPPAEVQNAISAQVEMEDQDKGRPFSVPILRMRRLEK